MKKNPILDFLRDVTFVFSTERRVLEKWCTIPDFNWVSILIPNLETWFKKFPYLETWLKSGIVHHLSSTLRSVEKTRVTSLEKSNFSFIGFFYWVFLNSTYLAKFSWTMRQRRFTLPNFYRLAEQFSSCQIFSFDFSVGCLPKARGSTPSRSTVFGNCQSSAQTARERSHFFKFDFLRKRYPRDPWGS